MEDTKLFLRAVLGSAAGMQQSNIIKEYYQTTGEKIQYPKYGFKNIYDFLVSLEGEVTRLEFSPKHGDNLVYAVLDKTKYASKHAMKYASKVNTGMKSKSPEQIILWKKECLAKGGILPAFDKKPGRNNSRRNRHNQMKKGNDIQEKRTKEEIPTVSEWFALRKLLPESDGVFRLCVRNIGVNQKNVKFQENALYTHFSPYNIIQRSLKTLIVNSRQVTYISFTSFFNAYRAWKEKHKTIVMGNRIGLEPAGGNLNALSTGVYMIFVIHLPVELLMSTFVTLFAKYSGLICIDPRPREHCAIISYSNIESAHRACKEVTSITVNGNKEPITIQLLDERPSMPFGAVGALLKGSVENKSVVKLDEAKSAIRKITPPSISPVSANSDLKENTELSNDNLSCGFCINYQQAFQMFQITCRKKPKSSEDLQNEIQFIVTHQVDPIRFWGWLMSDTDKSVKKLTEIENNIATTMIKIQPTHVLPKEGQRGAALFKGGGKENWYRCYVLSSNSETDMLEIFYCDYGNSEVISRDIFRSTYNDVWCLPPQAVPFKMHGFELRDTVDLSEFNNKDLQDGQVLNATVVKTSHSQSHIIEIKDVSNVLLKSSYIDARILGSWCKSVGDEENKCGDDLDVEGKIDVLYDSIQECESGNTVVDQEENSRIESLYDYDDKDLVLGLLTAAHNPNLLYLKLGDVNNFAQLQMAIDESELNLPNKLEKCDILLLKSGDQKRRVLLLQVLIGFGKVKVLHVDYGVIEWVLDKDIYQLAVHLQDSPFQARPAALAGIDCTGKLEEAIKYLKSMLKIVIKTNVIHESTSGKIHVELFDLRFNKSINKEMIDKGLAVHVNNITDTDDEISPNMVHLPVKELDTHVSKRSLLPLETDLFSMKFNQEHYTEGNENYNAQHFGYDDLPKLMDVNTWLDKNNTNDEMMHSSEIIRSANDKILANVENDIEIRNFGSGVVENGDESILYNNFFQDEDGIASNEDEPESYPPPDIVASNKVSSIQVDQGIDIEGRKIQICDEIDDRLSLKEIKDVQYKWTLEKKHLIESKEKLEGLLHMPLDDLTDYYKVLKKEKLNLKLRIKKAQRYSNKLENEYSKIVKETNQILSLI